jgi:hypothetical protein
MTQLDATGAVHPDAMHFGYPAAAMTGDYLRAAAGLVPTLAIFATVSVGSLAASP